MRAAIAVLLGAWLGCAPNPAPAQPAGGERFVFTLATFNVYEPAWSDEETVAAVGATGADVIFLQEVTPSWQRVLEERYAAAYPHRSFAATPGTSGLGVLSRFPLHDERVFAAPIRHPASLIGVQTPAGTFRVLNVHLRPVFTRRGKTFIGAYLTVSRDHVRELEAFLKATPELPALIVGDFNENVGGWTFDWLERLGFSDALARHRPGQHTWRALSGAARLALDHVLFDPRFTSLDAWVVDRGNSDHLPVVARLSVGIRRRAADSVRSPP